MDMAEQKKTTTCSSSTTAELATASLCSLSEYARVKGKGSVVHQNMMLRLGDWIQKGKISCVHGKVDFLP
jgi:hypothetical protein